MAANHAYDRDDWALESTEATQKLRALAQSNLTEIEQEIALEVEQKLKVQRELQKYSKQRAEGRPGRRQTAADALPNVTKPSKLRPAQDVLDRIQWDPRFDVEEYIIGYLERFDGILEMPAANWLRETTEEDFIPQHRIKYIKRCVLAGQSEIVWDRDNRIDRIFRNTGLESDDVNDGASDGGVSIQSGHET